MVYIVMGVSGCGKTTIGKRLAEHLGIPFYDADDYHSPTNIDKMKNLTPLDDKDRAPWLSKLAVHIHKWNKADGAVLACSALKETYRQVLSKNDSGHVVFIHLTGTKGTIHQRMNKRKEHFFSSDLLETQFKELEVPRNAVTACSDRMPEEVCRDIIEKLIRSGYVLPKG
jgi:carbohydrate kinase (thermoresistant glucokinase family)